MELDVDGTREHDGNLHENGDDVCKAVVEMEFPAGRQVVLLDESLHACWVHEEPQVEGHHNTNARAA